MANQQIKFKRVASIPSSGGGMVAGDVIFCTDDHTIYVATGAQSKEAYYGGRVKDAVLSDGKLTISYMDGSAETVISFSDITKALDTSVKALDASVNVLDASVKALEAASPVAGKDIDISTNKSINVSLDENITVMGVTVGNLSNGSTITAGSSLSDILKKILLKTIDVTAVLPTTTVGITSGATSGSTYEVGTSLTLALGHTYADGKFTGAESAYSYTLSAGCAEGATTYKYDEAATDVTFTKVVTEGTHTIGCTTAYGASTAAPKKNNGDDSSVSIAAGTATSGDISIYGKFYGYVGYSTKTAAGDFDSASITALAAKSWITVDGTTTLLTGGATSDGRSIVVAVPAKYKLADIENSFGGSILANFSSSATVSYTNGSTTTDYKVYVYPITSGAQVAYKNVKITKA